MARTPEILFAKSLAVGFLLYVVAVACTGGNDDDDFQAVEFDTGISVEEALSGSPGDTVTVNGWLAMPVFGEQIPRLCTRLERPEPYRIACVEPAMVALINLDRYPGVWEADASKWVNEPVQVTGKLVASEGRALELDPYDCLANFNDRCRLPAWRINPGAASAATATPQATTERRQLIPPTGGVSTATQFRGFPVARTVIAEFGNIQREVLDEAEVEAEVPWPIVLPSYLPPGYDQIGLLQIDKPMPNLLADAAARGTRVQIGFTSGPQGPSFMLILNGGHAGTDGTVRVLVNGKPAEFGVNQARAQTLAWDLCGRTLMLSALESNLPKDELIRIAESVPEQCA